MIAVLQVHAAPTNTWDNSAATALWNTTDDNWTGTTTYVEGNNVIFDATKDARNPKTIYIGTAGPTPVNVSPGAVQFINAGVWPLEGGGLQGGASLNIGWDCSVIFSNYTADVLTFTGGTTIATGWLAFCPTAAGVYHFGTGPIIASQRGFYVGLRFAPTVAGCTLVNDFIVPSTGANAPLGGAYWYGTINGAKVLGTITMNGPLQMVNVTGPAASNRLDATVILTGDRRIVGANGAIIFSPIDGGGTNALTIDMGGNSDTWTDWSMSVNDDTNTPTWNIGGLSKFNTGNVVFKSYRDLGSNINLRTGAIILGGLGTATNLIRDNAAINGQGGKILLRRDVTNSQTETVGSINLQWGNNEIRLSPTNNATYTLASAAALTRSNRATALVTAPNLGGTNGASGAGQIRFPSAPPLIGGGGAAGSTTISIVPFLIGGTTIDAVTTINGDAGSTFVTYDAGTTSLSNLSTTTEFKTNIAGSGATDNVRKTTNETLSAGASINSLILDAASRSVTIDGAQTLTVNSGAILARGPSTYSATVDVSTLDFAGGEGVVSVVDVSPSSYGTARLRINSVIQNGGLTKAGYGRLDLYGNSTFTGPFVVNSGQGGNSSNTAVFLFGTLATTNIQLYNGGTWLEANDRLPAGCSPMVDTRATLYINGFTQTLANVRSGVSGGGAVNIGAAGVLTVNPPADDTNAFTGTITTGTLVKDGTNVWTVAGVLTPTTLNLKSGILRRTAVSTGSPGKLVFLGGLYELGFSSRDWTYNTQYAFGAGGGGWSAKSASVNPVTIWAGGTSQEWGVSPGFVLDGDPLLFSSIYADGCIRYDSPFNLGNTAGTPQLREIRVADNPASTTDYAYVIGVISGTAADKVLWKTGDGLLQLVNGNTYVGGTKISGGTIQIPSDVGLGAAPASPVTNVTFDGGGLQFSASFTVVANRRMLINPGKTATLDTQTYNDTIAGKITGGTDGAGLTKLGLGALTLSGTNDYVGVNTISNGTVTAGNGTALGANTNPLTMSSTATLDMNGTNLFIGPLNSATGAVIVNNGAGTITNTLTVTVPSGTATFNGRINNGATRKIALTKLGSGALILNGTNTYTGPTLVSEGTLGGSGVIPGTVTVASNATIAAGTAGGVGMLTIGGNLLLQEGCRIEADAVSGSIDRVNVGGALVIPTNATVNIGYLGGGWPAQITLFSAASLSGATNSSTLTGWTVTTTYPLGGSIYISGTNVLFRRSMGSVYVAH